MQLTLFPRTQPFRTPGTNLEWSDLAGWVKVAWQLDRRRCCAAVYAAEAAHLAAFPIALIRECEDPAALEAALHLWIFGPNIFRRPHRGQRADAPQTTFIVEAKNRLKQLANKADEDEIPHGPNWLAMHGNPA